MTDFSVLIPFSPRRPEQVLPYAALVQWTAARRLWQGQAMLVDAAHAAASASGAGFRVPLGLGVTLMPLRHPYDAAHQVRSLALTTGQPVVAGFGPGQPAFQASMRGKPYASPLTASREYVGIVRGLLTGEIVRTEGQYFSCHGGLPPATPPQVEVGLGVLRPGMARLAGEVADRAITWLTPATYVRDTLLPALREGAAKAGREVPKVTAIVPVALRRPDREPEQLALSSNAAHLAAGHYQDMLRRSGIEVVADDPVLSAKRLVAGGGFLHGDLDEVSAALDAYREAGADEVVLNLTGVFNTFGQQAALDDLKKILAARA
ncbi:LLM class flavin-dependent oxidoreductase [Streptomyces sp. NA04227]|uniref:LLM class flavin-dependent oxidoreductase n=1 Tax=Streptomyces sp. NA04227 TaxID=2742136 RepID=UPI0015918EC4|nr:LLM class flavin-dependent oxidoreductase [Streptomyces sp. NA04227]QKW08014.1 LLM class flavin-dependent oxidoreductase [Streptomyces sp. NA04227]